MSDYTKIDALKEAIKDLNPVKEKQKKQRKTIFENFGIIVTLSVIVLSMVLFAYDKGYCETYNLPSLVFSFDVTRFIPIGAQFISILIYLFIYISSVLTDKITKHKKFSIIRVLLGSSICSWFILMNHYIYALGLWCILIMVLLPILFELALLFFWKITDVRIENTKINEDDFEYEKRDIIRNSVFPEYSLKMIASIISLIVIFSPIIGKFNAVTQREYQVFVDNNQAYAVIVDYSDKVLAQKAKINKDFLTIETSDYSYFLKENVKYVWVRFKDVKIHKKENNALLKDLN